MLLRLMHLGMPSVLAWQPALAFALMRCIPCMLHYCRML